jgi:hypothetical protein
MVKHFLCELRCKYCFELDLIGIIGIIGIIGVGDDTDIKS